MGIDASIYQNAQVNPVQFPDPMDVATKALQYQTLKIQQGQMQRQMMTQAAIQNAYATNTDPNSGQVDQNGVISSINKVAPWASGQVADQFAATNKAQGEAYQAKMKAADDAASKVWPVFNALASPDMPEDQRATLYPQYMQNLSDNGVDISKLGTTYDPQTFQQHYAAMKDALPGIQQHLANQKMQNETPATGQPAANLASTQAATNKTNVEAANAQNNPPQKVVAAEELGKFATAVADPSVRNRLGQLAVTQDKADKISYILNAGAPANETPEQRFARLDQMLPQFATDVGVSSAAAMSGGVPDEALIQKVSPDTMNAKIATLKQNYSANPTPSNQGALLSAYGDFAKKLSDYSSSRSAQIVDHLSAGFPNAQKWYPDRMAQIAKGYSSPDLSGSAAASSDTATSSQASPSNFKADPANNTVSPIVLGQYAIKHGMKLTEAQKSLESKGYVIGR